jgi:putative membrane protein
MFKEIFNIVADHTQKSGFQAGILWAGPLGAAFEYTDYPIIKFYIMKTVLFPSFLALIGMGLWACNSGSSSEHTDSVDSAKTVNKEVKAVQADASNFAVKAADGGMMEVELGKWARDHATSQRVRAFGAMMVKDHTEANNNLKTIASSLQVALPDSIGNDSRKEIEKLEKKKGKDFDKAYVDMMVDDHKKDIGEFRKCADNCSDSSIKSFASNTLPVLEKHLDSIQAIAGKK